MPSVKSHGAHIMPVACAGPITDRLCKQVRTWASNAGKVPWEPPAPSAWSLTPDLAYGAGLNGGVSCVLVCRMQASATAHLGRLSGTKGFTPCLSRTLRVNNWEFQFSFCKYRLREKAKVVLEWVCLEFKTEWPK